jgi:hypothetical protein
VIRHGGAGKVIARISGPAPAGGFTVNTSTDPSGHLDLDPVITIPAGETQISLAVPASLFAESNGIELLPDQPVDVTISKGSASFTKSTIIRDFGDEPRPTATVTPTASSTATSEPTATSTATTEPTATSTATLEPTATETMVPTSTATTEPTATATVDNRLITIAFTATGSPGFCNLVVTMTGFAPETLYTVNLYSTYPDGSGPSFEGSTQTTTDSSGNSTIYPFSFNSFWAFKAIVGDYVSGVFPSGC